MTSTPDTVSDDNFLATVCDSSMTCLKYVILVKTRRKTMNPTKNIVLEGAVGIAVQHMNIMFETYP